MAQEALVSLCDHGCLRPLFKLDGPMTQQNLALLGNRIPPNSTLIFEKELVRIIYGKLRWHRLSGPECSADEKVKTESNITVFYSGFTKAQVKKYSG